MAMQQIGAAAAAVGQSVMGHFGQIRNLRPDPQTSMNPSAGSVGQWMGLNAGPEQLYADPGPMPPQGTYAGNSPYMQTPFPD